MALTKQLSENNRDLRVVESLKKRGDFLRLRKGKRFSTPRLTVQAMPSDQKSPRIGYTVTTKIGNAVIRNRIKRRLRAAAGGLMSSPNVPISDYVLIAKRQALTADFSTIVKDLQLGLDHVHRNGAKGKNKRVGGTLTNPVKKA